VCLPNEDSRGKLFDGACHVLRSDDSIVPVATTLRLVVVVIHHHTTADRDVGNMQLVTSTWTNMS